MGKVLLLITFLILPFAGFSQETLDWSDAMSKDFYSAIDPEKKIACCDKSEKKCKFAYTFELPTFYSHIGNFSKEEYFASIDSSYFSRESKDMIASFRKKFSEKKLKKIKKSCYHADITYVIDEDVTCGGAFVTGTATLTYTFQP